MKCARFVLFQRGCPCCFHLLLGMLMGTADPLCCHCHHDPTCTLGSGGGGWPAYIAYYSLAPACNELAESWASKKYPNSVHMQCSLPRMNHSDAWPSCCMLVSLSHNSWIVALCLARGGGKWSLEFTMDECPEGPANCRYTLGISKRLWQLQASSSVCLLCTQIMSADSGKSSQMSRSDQLDCSP
jgi:hypothetical protein